MNAWRDGAGTAKGARDPPGGHLLPCQHDRTGYGRPVGCALAAGGGAAPPRAEFDGAAVVVAYREVYSGVTLDRPEIKASGVLPGATGEGRVAQ